MILFENNMCTSADKTKHKHVGLSVSKEIVGDGRTFLRCVTLVPELAVSTFEEKESCVLLSA